jgi:cytochrome c556
MRRTLIVAGAAFVMAAPPGAMAQAKPDVLVKQRQAGMTLIGKYFGPLGGMAQGRVPYDAKVVQRNADYLAVLDELPWDGFDPSTTNQTSRAKPELFKEMDKFKAGAERLQAEVTKLKAVAGDGNEAAVKAQIGVVGKACAACHDAHREKQ